MAPSRKSPVNPMAAMFSQVHQSPATWVVFERTEKGELRINKVGQFMTGFHSDKNWCNPQFRTTFRTSYVHPYYGQQHWRYTPAALGLVPIKTFRRSGWLNQPLDPPTDKDVRNLFYSYSTPVRDQRDPYVFWQPCFIVKLQHAHKVLGCTPDEFRRVYLAKFYQEMESKADMLFWQEEDDKRRAAEEADELV